MLLFVVCWLAGCLPVEWPALSEEEFWLTTNDSLSVFDLVLPGRWWFFFMFVMYLIILNVLVVLVVEIFEKTKREMRSKTTLCAQVSQIIALKRLSDEGGITLSDIKVRSSFH